MLSEINAIPQQLYSPVDRRDPEVDKARNREHLSQKVVIIRCRSKKTRNSLTLPTSGQILWLLGRTEVAAAQKANCNFRSNNLPLLPTEKVEFRSLLDNREMQTNKNEGKELMSASIRCTEDVRSWS